MTMFLVTNSFNDGFGTSRKPIFTRGNTSDDGFVWAWRDTNSSTMNAAVARPRQPYIGAQIDRRLAVTAITFHENGWTSLHV